MRARKTEPLDPWRDAICAVEAHITVLARSDGHEIQPVFDGYRNSCAHFDDLGSVNCCAFFDSVDGEILSAGESGSVQMRILGPAVMEDKLHAGSAFHLEVGYDRNANGVITRVIELRRLMS